VEGDVFVRVPGPAAIKAYKVACCQPTQIRQAYDLPSLYASGVTGRAATIVGELVSAVGR
jgi:hypothetical protein